MDRIEFLMRASLPPSPAPSPQPGERKSRRDERQQSTKEEGHGNQPGDVVENEGEEEQNTPTKVLDVSAKNC